MKNLIKNWRNFVNESKLRVFDFDDTIVKTDARVRIMTTDGKSFSLSAAEFSTHKKNPNYQYNFDYVYLIFYF